MEEHGLTPAALETQLKNFREGFPFLPVTRAASCGDGIRVLDAAGIEQAAARYDRAKESLRVVKFVPASAPRPVCSRICSSSSARGAVRL